MKKSEIKIVVSLDDENIPEKIEWDAEDSMSQGLSETKSISLSLWDEKKNNTLRIDLWTPTGTLSALSVYQHPCLNRFDTTTNTLTKEPKVAILFFRILS